MRAGFLGAPRALPVAGVLYTIVSRTPVRGCLLFGPGSGRPPAWGHNRRVLIHPQFDPVAIAIGPLQVRWYGLMYLAGFACAYLLGRSRCRAPGAPLSQAQFADLLFYAALGVILGGRLGYSLFYQFDYYLHHPLQVLMIWHGGMSFHGGLLGVLVAMALYGRRLGVGFFTLTDFIAPLVPPGLAFGRIGNFINGELWGRITDVPWGMVFPQAGPLARHPSQLYEAVLEGLLLFVLLWRFSASPRPPMAVSGLFLLGYGSARFVVEFFRQPDDYLGFIFAGWVTMGHLLSLPMILAGALLLWLAYRPGASASRQ